jgi:nitroreductase
MHFFKVILRFIREVLFLVLGFIYDYYRFVRYSSWLFKSGANRFNFSAVKIYHSIEKSLSFKNRSKGSGWTAVLDFIHLLKKNHCNDRPLVFHEKVGINVVREFVHKSTPNQKISKEVDDFVNRFGSDFTDVGRGGVLETQEITLKRGVLADPQSFFLSRYSVRDFKEHRVDESVVHQAMELSSKTPSVCNRESYFIYYIDDKDLIGKILKFQNGNRGFGDAIPGLIIITSDLRAFVSQIERYQYWIDGGMYAMSLVYAFHSLGLGTCCLNWSQSFLADIKARNILPIDNHHTIMMLLAVGYPSDDLKVCASLRSPILDHYKHIVPSDFV